MKRSQSLSLWKMPLLTKMTMTDVSVFRWLSEMCLCVCAAAAGAELAWGDLCVLHVRVVQISWLCLALGVCGTGDGALEAGKRQ